MALFVLLQEAEPVLHLTWYDAALPQYPGETGEGCGEAAQCDPVPGLRSGQPERPPECHAKGTAQPGKPQPVANDVPAAAEAVPLGGRGGDKP